MIYQRGTDLKHCPDGCEFAEVVRMSRASVPRPFHRLWYDRETYDFRCYAKPSDTCPREQAERADKQCANCGHSYENWSLKLDCPMWQWGTSRGVCSTWKERTNG